MGTAWAIPRYLGRWGKVPPGGRDAASQHRGGQRERERFFAPAMAGEGRRLRLRGAGMNEYLGLIDLLKSNLGIFLTLFLQILLLPLSFEDASYMYVRPFEPVTAR